MDAGALHQLHNAGDEHVPPVADGVDLHFPTLNVLVHQNGLVLVDFHGAFQVAAQLALVRHDLHGAAAQHEAGTHQHGVADLVCRRETVLDFGDGSALGLGDVQLLQELFKGVPVFGSVDGLAAGADDLHAPVMEGLGQIDGGLTAQRRDHAVGLFKVDDVHHILGGQRLEVQLVGGGVVGGDGLGVVVDDDGLVARLLDGHDGVDGGVVEFHALTDADGACAQHHDLLFVCQPGDVPAGVGGVEVGDIRAGVAGVHHTEGREHTVFSAEIGHVRLGAFPEPAHIFIAEAHLLRVQKGFRLFDVELQVFFHIHNALDGVQEIHVNGGDLMNLLHGDTPVDHFRNGEDVVGAEHADIVQQLLRGHVVEFVMVDVVRAYLQRADALEQGFLQIGADAHDLAGGHHLGTQNVDGGGELVEGEPGQLGDDVVQLRLKGGVGVGNFDVLQRHAHGDFRGDPGNGVAGGLGGQRGGTGDPGIDLNEIVSGGIGVKGKLDVAAALHLQRPDDFDGGVVEHLHVVVAEGHDGGDHHAVTGVDAHGVDVLHAADGDGVVTRIPHDLEFDLLVALDGLFHQNLMNRGEGKGVETNLHQLVFIVSKAAAGAAQSKGGAKHHGVADALGGLLGLLQGVGNFGGDDRLADGLAQLLEKLTIFGTLDGLAGGAQQPDPAFPQNALLFQLHGQIQTRLTADAGDDGVGTLVADDLGDIFQRQRLHVDLVGDDGVGHDGGGVGVAQHHLVALFFQGKTGLRPGVVKLSSLTDDDGAGANDENFLDVGSFCHGVSPLVIWRYGFPERRIPAFRHRWWRCTFH